MLPIDITNQYVYLNIMGQGRNGNCSVQSLMYIEYLFFHH